MIYKEIKIFFAALLFFTRLPVPYFVSYDPISLKKSCRYISLVGIIVGVLSAFIYVISDYILPKSIAIILSMASSILITGGFHEDGFADFCDGFGGGSTKEKILNIMKDSNIGTFGVLGLIIILWLKYMALIEIDSTKLFLILTAGHSLSRFGSIIVMHSNHYAREDITSKSKPVIGDLKLFDLTLSGLIGISPVFFSGNLSFLLSFLLIFSEAWLFKYYFDKKIGGYTGDCLGAVQQVSEVVFYLFIVAVSKS